MLLVEQGLGEAAIERLYRGNPARWLTLSG
jgi:hypothetical protein